MKTQTKLVSMINHIAANLATDADPVGATADHIRTFWDPRMKALLREHGTDGLNDTATSAFGALFHD
jgi:formate dehydrogenase subunit delta